MQNRTPLYEKHLEANAKMVDFGGWDMPLNYGSQIEEHNQVRQDAGMFDVSARPCVPSGALTLAIPLSKFVRMVDNMEESFFLPYQTISAN